MITLGQILDPVRRINESQKEYKKRRAMGNMVGKRVAQGYRYTNGQPVRKDLATLILIKGTRHYGT